MGVSPPRSGHALGRWWSALYILLNNGAGWLEGGQESADTGNEEIVSVIAHRQRLRDRLTDIVRKQENVLKGVEDAEPNDPFTQGLRGRYNELDRERQTVIAELEALELQEAAAPVRPAPEQVDIMDALPFLAVNLHRAPDDLLDRLFDMTQLTVRVHYRTNEATLTAVLPTERMPDIAGIGEGLRDCANTSCTKTAGQTQCASWECPG